MVKMPQSSTPCPDWAKLETPIQTLRADTQAGSQYYSQVPHRKERAFEAVRNYIENIEPGFEPDNDSIPSGSSIFAVDSDNCSISNVCTTWCADTTILVDMAAKTKYSPQGDQGHSEIFATNASTIADWADEQGPSAPPASVANSNQHIQKLTPVVYDIPTLLRLRNEIDGKRLELRVSPAALAENVFKDSTNARLTQQKNMFSRGLSSFAHRSTDSDEELTFQGRLMHHPSRQPRAPPETPQAQQNEGFVRFLKQYASPPHHRVTAGGRIVPAGPLSPPPMLTLNSIDGMMRKHPGGVGPYRNKDRTSLASSRAPNANIDPNSGEFAQTRVGSARMHNPMNFVQNHGVGDNGYGIGLGITQAAATGTHVVQNTAPVTQFPSGPVAMTMLQDGSTIYFLNGLMYRSYWNGTETVMEPLSVASATPALQDYSFAGNSQAWFGAQSTTNPQTILGTAASTSQGYCSLLNPDSRVLALNNQFDILQSRLTALDKHMALHLHELPPTVHAGLVAQRKELVEHLDNLRVAREQLERSGSTATSVFIPYPTANMSDYQHNFGPQTTTTNVTNPAATVPLSLITPKVPPAPVFWESTSDQLGSAVNNSRGGGTNKGLSPNAPAFVPSFAQPLSSATGNSHSNRVEQPGHPSGTSASSGNVLTPQGSSSLGASASNNHEIEATFLNSTQQIYPGEKAVTQRFGARSDPRSSSQDTLPIVSVQEAEYVDRLGLNPTKGPKLYCTTPAEFQEVIRRAREQATLYGCFGGQSKDPAYDAEQDIRWAMSDFEPIPLAKRTPDHFSKPRPWNWNDSAYNYRIVRYTSGSSENGTDRKAVSMDAGNVEPRTRFPATPPKVLGNDTKLHRHVSSWDHGLDQNGWQYSNTVRLAEATPPDGAEYKGFEDLAASRGPLSATSGNSYRSKKAKGDQTLKATNPLSKRKKESENFIEGKAQVDEGEKFDTTTATYKQPETPHGHKYHAYVESYDGSPTTPRTKFTLHLVPANAVVNNNAYSNQGLSENNASRDIRNFWGPVIESKDRWGPDYEEDNLSLGSWGKPDPQGKQEPVRSGEKAPKLTPTVRLPTSVGNLLAEHPKTLQPNTSISGNEAGQASDDIFNASEACAAALAEVKKKQPPFKKNKSLDSSSTTSNRSKHEFLRGMLDSTLHSSTRSKPSRVKHARYIPASEREQAGFRNNASGWEDSGTNKEDAWSENQVSNDRGRYRQPEAARVTVVESVYSGQDARAIKAPSSLASSTYHAQAHMPQYDRVGNQLASAASRGYIPQHQGTNGGRVSLQNPNQANPQRQHIVTETPKYPYQNLRYEQKPGQNPSAGEYGEEFMNSF